MGGLLDSVRSRLFGQPELQKTDITDELRGAGTAFATLIEGVGLAVAKTQRELDETAGHIIKDMAKTEVETVQAVVSTYGNDGNLTGVEVIPGKTSALSIAVPPALAFQTVNIQAAFLATEFSATSTSNVNVNLAGFSVGSGRGFSASAVNVNTDVQTEVTQDMSVGSMSVTAHMRSKPVKALPKPLLIFKGPSLALSMFGILSIQNINPVPADPAKDPPYLERRRAVILIELKDASGAAMSDPKTIALDCGSLDWAVTDSTGVDVTTGPVTAGGTFHITVSRTATAVTEPKKDFVVRGSLNLVNGTVNVSL